jgi:small subunit ribosomal protein S4e
VVLRDVLHYADNLKEVKEILNKKQIKIDGKLRRSHRFPIGLMDTIEIGDESYRVLPSKKGVKLNKIAKDEAGIKLLKIINKKSLMKGKVQLNCHDGRNIIVDKDGYKTGDVVVFDLNKKSIIDVLKYKRGSVAFIIGGQNMGQVGEIEEIITVRGFHANKAVMKIDNSRVETKKDYIFVLGNDKPFIKIE